MKSAPDLRSSFLSKFSYSSYDNVVGIFLLQLAEHRNVQLIATARVIKYCSNKHVSSNQMKQHFRPRLLTSPCFFKKQLYLIYSIKIIPDDVGPAPTGGRDGYSVRSP